jgi:hypothetical protein
LVAKSTARGAWLKWQVKGVVVQPQEGESNVSQQSTPYAFTTHRILAFVAFVLALILLILYLVSATTLGWEKTVLYLLFVFVLWRTLDVLLP